MSHAPSPTNPAAPVAAANAPSWFDEPPPHARRLPLRFMWQMDREGRFSLGSDEFTRLIGPRTAAASAGCGARSPRRSGSIPMAA